jgi:hypothetical protein
MLLKDLAAAVCGIIFAILCFALLLHFNLFGTNQRTVQYQKEQQKTVNIERAVYDY